MPPDAEDCQLSLPLHFQAPTPEPPAAGEAAGRLRRVMLGGQLCHFRLRRARRRTIGFQIDDQGLTVSAPRWVSLRAIEEAILEKERWIRIKLAQWQDWRARHGAHRLRWVDGAAVPYLAEGLTLRLRTSSHGGASSAVRAGRDLVVAGPIGSSEAEVRETVQEWLRNEALRILGERVQLLATRGAVRPFTWKLSSARTQWGSCNEDGRIRLNWRLVFFPIPVIDYVAAHELAHLKELNHGRPFWQEVERLLPDFRAARDQIKDEELAALPL
jgi:predicted metal-dependent hydrolase